MPTFSYEAMNKVGQPVKGTVEATSSEEAIAKVRAQGHFPTKIKEASGGGSGKGPGVIKRVTVGADRGKRKTAGSVSTKLLCQFTRQLATLVDAGLPILRSMRILEQQQKPGALKMAIGLVAEDVEGGATLSEAMSRHPKTFNRLYVNMVRAGELGGVLDVILQRLADFMEKAQHLKSKVLSAMIYPSAVISFAVLIVVGIMLVVIPKFESIFSDMGQDLPPVTALLLNTSNWIKNDYGWAVVLVSPFAIIFGLRLIRMSESGKFFLDSVALHVPVFGQITGKTAVARFTRTLGTLLAAGVPILEALTITRDTAGNEAFARALSKVHDGIREGESFAEPLRQAKIVEPMVVNMIDVGEETGELDSMLGRVADTYEGEVDTLVSSMVSLLEPFMVISLGLIVGFIVVALFMPLVSMIQNVGG